MFYHYYMFFLLTTLTTVTKYFDLFVTNDQPIVLVIYLNLESIHILLPFQNTFYHVLINKSTLITYVLKQVIFLKLLNILLKILKQLVLSCYYSLYIGHFQLVFYLLALSRIHLYNVIVRFLRNSLELFTVLL